ncbi:hypothetical protein ZYGR_0AI02650 [Zygosaccharomyces rouxii]|uniref:Copper transport protein n=1 Tax=Zygosaccharomyces rouxii TaxID=4956 RepID=A0A1Q3ABS2_ZYGRO|nr:hypothetical protein ZYGR_0AI02650 [Zygosaccharomyces rouxii]
MNMNSGSMSMSMDSMSSMHGHSSMSSMGGMSSKSSSMSMPMSTGSSMSMSGSMSMPRSTSSSMPMSGSMSMSGNMPMSTGMDMGGSNMMMNSWLTPTYRDYPVLFKGLTANSSGKQFGIFLLIVVTAFVYKFLNYLSWCLEVHWFKNWSKSDAQQESRDAMSQGDEISGPLPKMPNFMFDLFCPSWMDLFHDFIRAILTFCSTMLIYMLMLVAMTFVITYVFAVITGLTLAEVFFNRCKICTLRRWEVQRQIQSARTCPGSGNCKCGRHASSPDAPLDSGATPAEGDKLEQTRTHVGETDSTTEENDNDPADCCCTNGEGNAKREQEAETHLENEISENARWNEQAGTMDANLLPAEKFRQ